MVDDVDDDELVEDEEDLGEPDDLDEADLEDDDPELLEDELDDDLVDDALVVDDEEEPVVVPVAVVVADEDDEDDDATLLALDLIGAALFGAARVVATLYDGTPRRFALQVLRDSIWHTVTTQGSRPWNPFALRTTRIYTGEAARPTRYAPARVTPLPWAPWAGQCGFYGTPLGTAPAELPVNGELDLHNFHPREIKPLVLAYVNVCLARGITQLRIVHGKGIGNLRRTVHALLDRHPRVIGYRLGGHAGGGWGATIVDLSPGPDTPTGA